MSHIEARQFIQQASEAIQAGQYSAAVDMLDRSIALDSSDSEAHVLRGVALSNLNRTEEATQSFQRAISSAPHNPKAFYNFAVHLYAAGAKDQALEMAREAARLDPNHTAATDLVARIEREALGQGPQPYQPAPPAMTAPGETPFAAPPQTAGYYRPGYYDYTVPVHSLSFVERMGKAWDGIGWGLVVLGAGYFVYAIIFIARFISSAFQQQFNPNMDLMNSAYSGTNLAITLFSYALFLGSMLWMIFDLVDRRGNWIWIAPFVVACCCAHLQWLVLALYIPLGRSSR